MSTIIHIDSLRSKRTKIAEQFQKISDACDDIDKMLLSNNSKLELIKDVMQSNLSDATKVKEIKDILGI